MTCNDTQGYYLWFSSMYYQCLMIFPAMYNMLMRSRSNTKTYLFIIIVLLILNTALILGTWFAANDSDGYNHYDKVSGEKNIVSEYEDASTYNALSLAWYLFSPFWMVYFVIGAATAFLYDAYRPTEKSNFYIWGYVADICTILVILWSILLVSLISVNKFISAYEYILW